MLVALAGIIYAVLLRIYTHDWVRGWASIFVAVLFMGGVQLVTIGIIGEYIGRIYGEVKQRPLYFVMERLGFDDTREERYERPEGKELSQDEYTEDVLR
jgi:dolichol-phosphate mannosyltransferase